MNLEFLAHHWELIEPHKYGHRLDQRNQRDSKLPKDAFIQCYFDIKTFKLAMNKVYMTTKEGEQVQIEKEFSLASAKLIQ